MGARGENKALAARQEAIRQLIERNEEEFDILLRQTRKLHGLEPEKPKGKVGRMRDKLRELGVDPDEV